MRTLLIVPTLLAALAICGCSPWRETKAAAGRVHAGLNPTKPAADSQVERARKEAALFAAQRAFRQAAFASVDRYMATGATPDDIAGAALVAAEEHIPPLRTAYREFVMRPGVSEMTARKLLAIADDATDDHRAAVYAHCKKRVLDHLVKAEPASGDDLIAVPLLTVEEQRL